MPRSNFRSRFLRQFGPPGGHLGILLARRHCFFPCVFRGSPGGRAPNRARVDGVPSPDSRDARAAYSIQSALVRLCLEELQRALEAHEAARPFSWRGVAELGQVEEGAR